jgi:hypothetical protein
MQLNFPKASILKLTETLTCHTPACIQYYKYFFRTRRISLEQVATPTHGLRNYYLRHHWAAFSLDKVGMLLAFRPHVSTNTTGSLYCGHSTFTCLPSSQDNMILTPFCRSLALTAIFFRLYSFSFVEHPSPSLTEIKQQRYFIACAPWHRV